MITVVVIAILVAIAYPSYTRYVMRGNRSAASSFVLGVASKQEQYNLDSRQYAGTLSALGFATVPSEVSNNYTVTLAANNTVAPPTYAVTATPIGRQLNMDTDCGALSIDQTGNKTVSGSGILSSCW